jgi:preprotein translocase subunit SecB
MNAPSNEPVFAIQRTYLKDLSLEIPNAPQVFLEQQAPTVEIQLDVASQVIAEGIYESVVTATVTAKIGEKVGFLVECKEAGIFEIRQIPDEQMPVILNVVCPNIVYPYLRANVADVIQRAGFPPIHLAEINFEAMFQSRLQQMQQEQQPHSGLIVPPGVQ